MFNDNTCYIFNLYNNYYGIFLNKYLITVVASIIIMKNTYSLKWKHFFYKQKPKGVWLIIFFYYYHPEQIAHTENSVINQSAILLFEVKQI